MTEVRYTDQHEWIRLEGDEATVGITKYAAESLGDVVFVELPASGKAVTAGGEAAVVESVKAASDIYAPAGGTVTERQQRAGKGAFQGQRGPGRRRLVLQAEAHRQGRIRQADGRRRLREVRGEPVSMRYLPLTADDRRAMLAKIGAPDVDALFRDVPKSALALAVRLRSAGHPGRAGSRAAHVQAGGEEYRGGRGALLLRRGRLQASCSQRGGSSDPAFGIPHQLHALSAGNRAGHACSICSNSRPRWRC